MSAHYLKTQPEHDEVSPCECDGCSGPHFHARAHRVGRDLPPDRGEPPPPSQKPRGGEGE